MMVFRAARETGIEIDEQNFRRQLERAFGHHESGLERYRAGKDQGEQVHTLAYGLWALDIGAHKPDEVTEAVTTYLLNYQKNLGHWITPLDRQPAEAADFTSNYLAIRGLNRYGVAKQKEQIVARTAAVKQWLAATVTTDTEEEVFRLRLAYELKIAPDEKRKIVRKLIHEQRDDGGWAQKPEMKPDAYATGSVLVALHEAGDLPRDDPAWMRGIDYLLRTQKPDGSWHVVTRAKPMQVYFESGFPHGEDQFISAFATCWATKALLLALNEKLIASNSKPLR